jgi:fatty acid desaturase
MTKQKRKDPLIWGVLLITLGVLFLLKINIWYVLAHFWPVILILWGAHKFYYGLMERREEEERSEGI